MHRREVGMGHGRKQALPRKCCVEPSNPTLNSDISKASSYVLPHTTGGSPPHYEALGIISAASLRLWARSTTCCTRKTGSASVTAARKPVTRSSAILGGSFAIRFPFNFDRGDPTGLGLRGICASLDQFGQVHYEDDGGRVDFRDVILRHCKRRERERRA